MGDKSKIEWTDATWNPVVGCSKASPGCVNCYAERMAGRLARMGQDKYAAVVRAGHGDPTGRDTLPRWTGRTYLDEGALDQPLRWHRPRRVFVCSMGDLFHESVPFEWIAAVFGVMAAAPQHTFQVLTKRPGRMHAWFEWVQGEPELGMSAIEMCEDAAIRFRFADACYLVPDHTPWPLANVWLGTTVEAPPFLHRIDRLRDCPAAVRFLSLEPLLAGIDLRLLPAHNPGVIQDCKRGFQRCHECEVTTCVDNARPPGLDWIIAGGESGPGARPMHPDWVRSIRDQCAKAGVPFLFKQWGEWGPGAVNITTGKPCFRTFPDKLAWVHKARTWVNGGTCLDAGGRVLERGADFDSATYPVAVVHRVGKKSAGRLLDGRTWDEYPEVARG